MTNCRASQSLTVGSQKRVLTASQAKHGSNQRDNCSTEITGQLVSDLHLVWAKSKWRRDGQSSVNLQSSHWEGSDLQLCTMVRPNALFAGKLRDWSRKHTICDRGRMFHLGCLTSTCVEGFEQMTYILVVTLSNSISFVDTHRRDWVEWRFARTTSFSKEGSVSTAPKLLQAFLNSITVPEIPCSHFRNHPRTTTTYIHVMTFKFAFSTKRNLSIHRSSCRSLKTSCWEAGMGDNCVEGLVRNHDTLK